MGSGGTGKYAAKHGTGYFTSVELVRYAVSSCSGSVVFRRPSEQQKGKKIHVRGAGKHVRHSRNHMKLGICERKQLASSKNRFAHNFKTDFLFYIQIILVLFPSEYYLLEQKIIFKVRKIETRGLHSHLYRNIYFVRQKTQEHGPQQLFI